MALSWGLPRHSYTLLLMPAPPAPATTDRSHLAGVLMAIGAYVSWGIVVIYFKQVKHIPAVELIAHRVLWSLPFLFGLMVFTGGTARFSAMLRDRKAMRLLPLSTLLLAANWFLFVWVVVIGQVIQASLAYFITPLMMVVLGVLLLGERLRRMQAVGLGLAAAGVLLLIVAGGVFPWAALLIAVTWSLYSLVRKLQHSPAIEGLGAEVLLLVPASLAWLLWRGFLPENSVNEPAMDWLLLSAAGVVTAAPLVLFGAALRRIPLKTMGFLQYIAPTMQLGLAVLLYHEPFNFWSGVAFALIWTALIFYTLDTFWKPEAVLVEPAAQATPGTIGNIATDGDYAAPSSPALGEPNEPSDEDQAVPIQV